jgi:hypothetical protein
MDWGDLGRVVAAIATGGASEGGVAVNRARILAAVAVVALIQSCGGSSPSTPTPTPVPTPTPPVPVVVSQGSGVAVCRGCGAWYYFTLPKSGTVVTTVDYSFSDSVLWLWFAPGHCTYEMSKANQCSWTTSTTFGQKPLKASMVLEAGEYTFVIENRGTHDETVSFQVVFTPAAAAGRLHAAVDQSVPSIQALGPSGPQASMP